MLDTDSLDGFNWDEGNVTKNWDRHQVSSTECEEVFLNKPLLLADDVRHSANEVRNYALGQTDNGRLLFIAFTVRGTRIRVISARPMSGKERQIYGQANS
jgi:uncharacterized DUF497 family protein